MYEDLIADLDEYFCENYANYDKLCVQQGYRMPEMHTTKTDEYGRTFAYTLPANTMRLSQQENKAEILTQIKAQIIDKSFSFSFHPYGFFKRIVKAFSRSALHRMLKVILAAHKTTEEDALARVNVDEEIWTRICKGEFLPSKNLVLSLALTCHFTFSETNALLFACDEEFDFTQERDVAISYLLVKKIYNADMWQAVFSEYKVENLFIK